MHHAAVHIGLLYAHVFEIAVDMTEFHVRDVDAVTVASEVLALMLKVLLIVYVVEDESFDVDDKRFRRCGVLGCFRRGEVVEDVFEVDAGTVDLEVVVDVAQAHSTECQPFVSDGEVVEVAVDHVAAEDGVVGGTDQQDAAQFDVTQRSDVQ